MSDEAEVQVPTVSKVQKVIGVPRFEHWLAFPNLRQLAVVPQPSALPAATRYDYSRHRASF